MTINDGQLDHAKREVDHWKKRFGDLSTTYQKSFGLLKEVASCAIFHTSKGKYHEVQIPLELWDQIREMTDESEVGT